MKTNTLVGAVNNGVKAMAKLNNVITKVEKEVINMENLNNNTVKELREMAKTYHIKNVSKMKKAEIIDAILEAENKIAQAKACIRVANSNNKLNFGMYRLEKMFKEGASLESIAEFIDSIKNKVHANNKKRRSSIIKKFSKNNKIVQTYRVSMNVIKVGDKKMSTNEVFVQPAMESAITRQAEMVSGTFSDKTMVLNGVGTYDILNLSFDGDLMKNLNSNDKFEKDFFLKVFALIDGTKARKINLLINKTSGLAKLTSDSTIEVKEDEVLVTYDFMCASPSGLRTGSVMLGAVNYRDINGSDNRDRRVALLDGSIDGAFVATCFDEGGMPKVMDSLEAAFKALSRFAMGAPGSKELFEVNTYVVMKNIAQGAKAVFDGIEYDAEDTKDGNIQIAAESYLDFLLENNVPVSLRDIVGSCDQLRSAGLKSSGTYKTRETLVIRAKELIAKGNDIAYIVVDGQRFVGDENRTAMGKVIDAGLQEELFANIQMLADTNSMKMTKHNNVFKLVQLKTAYESDTSLNMVVNMAMLLQNPEKAYALLNNKAKAYLRDCFRDLGMTFTTNELGQTVPGEIDFSAIKKLNNEGQFINYLFKSEPAKVAAALPGVLRSIFTNKITGIKNLINFLKVPVDSLYTVVQADDAVLYGCTLLEENEIFSLELETRGISRVSGLRHPISSLFAVTTFNVVSTEEMLRRIALSDMTSAQKKDVTESYMSSKGYVIIPASHYLMEKHDGMDFDIDAMQLILDEEVVDILAEIPNRGSKIKSDDASKQMRKDKTDAENIIQEHANKGTLLKRPAAKKFAAISKTNNFMAPGSMTKNAKKVYDLGFNTVASIVREYLLTPIASVGEIATAFYNNALLYISLTSNEVSQEEKDAIVAAFKKYYACEGKTAYTSTIDRTTKSFEVNKDDCCNSVFRFAESFGSQADLELFLLDCCDYNRYLAETSIDSAKNNYYIINMFAHSFIAQGLGSDKNMKIEEAVGEEAKSIFTQGCVNIDREDTDNYFGINMIKTNRRSVLLSELADLTQEEAEKATLAVIDPLGKIRLELVEYANTLITCTAKKLEDYVKSPEAEKVRASLVVAGNDALDMGDAYRVNPVLNGIKNAYATLTSAVKEFDTFEGRVAKDYLKNVAIDGCRNMGVLAFNGMDDYTLGYFIVKNMIEETDLAIRCGAINPALVQVFEREICAFFAAEGFDNVGFVGEKIAYAHVDSTMVKLDDIEGSSVVVENGVAELNDMTIVMDNKKANIEGTIVKDGNKFVVMSERSFREVDSSKGVYFNNDTRYRNAFVDVTDLDIVSYEFVAGSQKDARGFKGYVNNRVYAVTAEGDKHLIGCLNVSNDTAEILQTVELTADNFKAFSRTITNNDGVTFTRTVFYLAGAETEELVNTLGQASSEFDCSQFAMPVMEGFEDASMPVEPAAEYFDMSTFAMPVDIA